MSDKKEQPSGRQRLEQAVASVGRAYAELVRIVEKHGADLESQHIAKTFAFLGEVHQGSHQRAHLSMSTAIAAAGAFSLDKDYGQQPLESPVLAPHGSHPEGRMVGTRKKRHKDPLEDPDASDFLEE